jgi:hypothetical protein
VNGTGVKLLPCPPGLFVWVGGLTWEPRTRYVEHAVLPNVPLYDLTLPDTKLDRCIHTLRKFTAKSFNGMDHHDYWVTEPCEHGVAFVFNCSHIEAHAALVTMAEEKSKEVAG